MNLSNIRHSVRDDSIRDSIQVPIGDYVWNSVRFSVRISVGTFVENSVRHSVCGSVLIPVKDLLRSRYESR